MRGGHHRPHPGPGALDRAELIQNYYGFAAPISGAELERQGIEGAKAVGVKFVTTEAVGLTYTDKLTVGTLDGDYPADAVILATGASRATPRIPGLAGLEGHGVSYCATCDAFFYRGKDVAVVGSGEYALHEVQALLPVAASVTLLLNGSRRRQSFRRRWLSGLKNRRHPRRAESHRRPAVRRRCGGAGGCVCGSGRCGQYGAGPENRCRRGERPHRDR